MCEYFLLRLYSGHSAKKIKLRLIVLGIWSTAGKKNSVQQNKKHLILCFSVMYGLLRLYILWEGILLFIYLLISNLVLKGEQQ